MAKITLCAINKITKNSPEDKIIDEYLKRIPWKVTVNQLEPKKNPSSEKQKNLEGTLLLESAEKNNFIVALDENGVNMSSHEFSKLIEQNSNITFLIGGAYGLSNEVKAKTNLLLSLGRITMPHILARIILIEQLYRCYTILNKHPYHK